MNPTLRRFVAWASKHNLMLGISTATLAFSATLFLLLIVYRSFVAMYGEERITVTASDVSIFRSQTGVWIRLTGEVASLDELSTHVSRELVHQGSNETIVLPSSERRFNAGAQPLNLTFTLPQQITNGTWCLTSTVRYKPSFSIIEKSEVRTLGCADVEPSLEGMYAPQEITGVEQP